MCEEDRFIEIVNLWDEAREKDDGLQARYIEELEMELGEYMNGENVAVITSRGAFLVSGQKGERACVKRVGSADLPRHICKTHPETDEEAKKVIPQGEQWEMIYDYCRDKGMSIAESILAVLNSRERYLEL